MSDITKTYYKYLHIGNAFPNINQIFLFSCVSSENVLIIVSQFELVEGKRGVHINMFSVHLA